MVLQQQCDSVTIIIVLCNNNKCIGARLGLSLCVLHKCNCGAEVDAEARHAMVCKNAPGRMARHQALNDVVCRAFISAGIPASKEPAGLCTRDGKRPDGLSLIPWQNGKPLAWDVTVGATLAESYVEAAARESGAVAEQAAQRKVEKYRDAFPNYCFQPIAVENLGAMNSSAVDFINTLGRRISSVSGEDKESAFLFQRISITIQRFNSILLFESFPHDDHDQ